MPRMSFWELFWCICQRRKPLISGFLSRCIRIIVVTGPDEKLPTSPGLLCLFSGISMNLRPSAPPFSGAVFQLHTQASPPDLNRRLLWLQQLSVKRRSHAGPLCPCDQPSMDCLDFPLIWQPHTHKHTPADISPMLLWLSPYFWQVCLIYEDWSRRGAKNLLWLLICSGLFGSSWIMKLLHLK